MRLKHALVTQGYDNLMADFIDSLPEGCRVEDDELGNYLVSKGVGKCPMFAVSLETQDKEDPEFSIETLPKSLTIVAYQKDCKQITAIGGQKVGLYIAHQILKKAENVKILIARKHSMPLFSIREDWEKDVKYIIGLDGAGEGLLYPALAGTPLVSPTFMQMIEEATAKDKSWKIATEGASDALAVTLKELNFIPSALTISVGILWKGTHSECMSEKAVQSAVALCMSFLKNVVGDYPHDIYKLSA